MNVEDRIEMLESKEYGHKYASRGQGNAGVTLGSIGTALGGISLLANGGLGNILGGNGWNGNNCNPMAIAQLQEIQAKDLEIARLTTDIKLRDANLYSDQKDLETYKYMDGRFREFEAAIAQQAVQNQANKDSFQILQERLDCAKRDLQDAIMRECEARKCNDNTIINYANATFYPKMVADVTVGTTTTAQTVYNPLPATTCGGCGCGR